MDFRGYLAYIKIVKYRYKGAGYGILNLLLRSYIAFQSKRNAGFFHPNSPFASYSFNYTKKYDCYLFPGRMTINVLFAH